MSKQLLDKTHIRPMIQQMRGETMTQGVRSDAAGQSCLFSRMFDNGLYTSGTIRFLVILPFEKPVAGLIDVKIMDE